MNTERDLAKEWSSVGTYDRGAILGSLRAHIKQSTERKHALERQFPAGVDRKLLAALISRNKAAEIALAILGNK